MAELTSQETTRRHWSLEKQMFLALFVGLLFGGLISGIAGDSVRAGFSSVFSFGADAFVKLMKMFVIPLVVSSLFVAIMNIPAPHRIAVIGLKSLFYFFSAGFLAVCLSLVVTNIIQPGVGTNLILPLKAMGVHRPSSLWDLLLRLIPENLFDVLTRFDLLSVLFFTALFAFFTVKVGGAEQQRIVTFFKSILKVFTRMFTAFQTIIPIGIFIIMVSLTISMSWVSIKPFVRLLGTALLVSTIHFFIILPLILKIIAGIKPYQYMKAVAPALWMALTTASSIATLPLTLHCVEQRGKVSNRVTNIAIPLGSMLNVDGSSIFLGVFVLFVAQIIGQDLSIAQQIVLIFSSLCVALLTSGIPQAHLVAMMIVFEVIGLPLEATGFLIIIERLAAMMKTVTSVWSDCVCAVLVDQNEP